MTQNKQDTEQHKNT